MGTKSASVFCPMAHRGHAQNIGAELQRLAQEIFESAVSFDAPVVKILYKNVAPENLRETRIP